MLEKEVEVINKLGLHARAAAKLVNVATSFACDVRLDHRGQEVDAKSIMGIMLLAAAQGSRITIRTAGDDETEALSAVGDLFLSRFGEAE